MPLLFVSRSSFRKLQRPSWLKQRSFVHADVPQAAAVVRSTVHFRMRGLTISRYHELPSDHIPSWLAYPSLFLLLNLANI